MSRSGFSLIELLLVVAIVTTLSTIVAPFASSFISNTNYNGTVDMLISTLRKAQSYSISNKNDSAWGICLNGSDLRLFTGTCASPTFSEDYSVPSTVTISGLNPITFSPYRGEPSSPLTINITNGVLTTILDLNSVGGLQFN